MKAKRGQRIDTIFVLMLFCIFAMSVLMVLMLNGKIYQNMNELSRAGHNEQVSLSYIWSRVKNEDAAGKLRVGDFNGRDALCFDEKCGGVSYSTFVYFYDGYIRELFCQSGLELALEDGERVIEAQDFSVRQLESGLIKVTAEEGSLLIYPRSGAGIILK